MSHTVLHITGLATPTAYSATTGKTGCVSSFSLDEIINPPKNVAGKQCLVTATYCNYETSKPLAENNKLYSVYFGWNVNSPWSQVYTSPNMPFIQPALGVRDFSKDLYHSVGPRIVYIPDGPFPVKFICRQQNLNNTLTESYNTVSMWSATGSDPFTKVVIGSTNNTLTLTYNGTTTTITIPSTTYESIDQLYQALVSLVPSPYILRKDGNMSYTRLNILRAYESGINAFTVGGTAVASLGFPATSSLYSKDFTIMTIMLNITPVE